MMTKTDFRLKIYHKLSRCEGITRKWNNKKDEKWGENNFDKKWVN